MHSAAVQPGDADPPTQLGLNSLRTYGLDNISAGMHGHGVAGILRITGHKNKIALRCLFFDLFRQSQTVDSAHVNVQKGHIAAVGLQKMERLMTGLEFVDLGGRIGFLDGAHQQAQGQRFVIDSDNVQKITPIMVSNIIAWEKSKINICEQGKRRGVVSKLS